MAKKLETEGGPPNVYTLADLEKISQETGIALFILQKEYGVYEYTFSSCEEAMKNYHGGYKSAPFFGKKDDFNDPAVLAYHRVWEKISLEEQPDVTVLDFEQAYAFLNICYPHGEQLVALVQTLEKCIGDDIEKIVLFFNRGYRFTFYTYGDCPVNALHGRLVKKVDAHYIEKIKKTKTRDELTAIHSEAKAYKLSDVRPFPEFYDLLSQRIAYRTTDINQLGNSTYALIRWKELHPKKSMEEILPTLSDFLVAIHRDRNGGELELTIERFFRRCENYSQARSMLDIGRGFFCPKDNYDPMARLYERAVERLVRKEFPNPKLADCHKIWGRIGKHYAMAPEIEKIWIAQSKKALTKPIPDFGKLYTLVHETLQCEVLRVWNKWGCYQLDGLYTWDELRTFAYDILPIPKPRNSNGYSVWAGNRDSFFAFLVFIKRSINVVPTLKDKMDILHLLLKMNAHANECHMFHIFDVEIHSILESVIGEDISLDVLWSLQEKICSKLSCKWGTSQELVLDEILKKDPTAINVIFPKIESHVTLYSKYLRIKVAYTATVKI